MTGQDAKSVLAAAWAEARASNPLLQDQIDCYVAASRPLIPEVLETYDRMVERLVRGEAGSMAPGIGDTLPGGLLCDANGAFVSLDRLWESSPLVVSFNRGHWCPYCRMELLALKDAMPAIVSYGAELVAIVPEVGECCTKLVTTNALPFPVLSDVDLAYALELGLVVWIGEDMKALYVARGIDLDRFQANSSWMLPIPATFVVAPGGRIVAREVEPDFRKRMPIETILDALKGLRS